MVDFRELESSHFFIRTDGDIVDSGQLVVGVVRVRSELRLNKIRISSLFKGAQRYLITGFDIRFCRRVFLFSIELVFYSLDKKEMYFADMGFDCTC